MDQGNLFDTPMLQGRRKEEVGILERKFYQFNKHMYHVKAQDKLVHILEYKNLHKFLKDIKECMFCQYFNQNIAVKQGIEVHISRYYYLQNKEEDIAIRIGCQLNMRTNY